MRIGRAAPPWRSGRDKKLPCWDSPRAAGRRKFRASRVAPFPFAMSRERPFRWEGRTRPCPASQKFSEPGGDPQRARAASRQGRPKTRGRAGGAENPVDFRRKAQTCLAAMIIEESKMATKLDRPAVALAGGILILRAVLLLRRPLWFDEIFTLWLVRQPPHEIVGHLRFDSGPPLFYLLAMPCAHIGEILRFDAASRLLSFAAAGLLFWKMGPRYS